MVFFVPDNGACSVHLLGKQQPDQLVGKGQFREAPCIIASFQYGAIQAVSASNEKDEVASAVQCILFNHPGQIDRSHLSALFIQGYQYVCR